MQAISLPLYLALSSSPSFFLILRLPLFPSPSLIAPPRPRSMHPASSLRFVRRHLLDGNAYDFRQAAGWRQMCVSHELYMACCARTGFATCSPWRSVPGWTLCAACGPKRRLGRLSGLLRKPPAGSAGKLGHPEGISNTPGAAEGLRRPARLFLFCQGVLGGHFGGTGLLGSSILNGLVIQRTRRGGGYRNRDDLLHGLYLGFVKDVAGQTVFDVAWGMSAEKSEMNDSLLTLWRDGCIYWQQRKTNWGCKVFTMKTLSWSGPGDYPTLETKMKGFQCKLVFMWVARPRLNSLACDVRGSLEAFSCSPPPSSRSRITQWRGGRAGEGEETARGGGRGGSRV